MKKQTITIELSGKSESDLELAFDEAARLIKNGNTSGMDSNDTGKFSFGVKREFERIKPDDITWEAEHIAAQFSVGDIGTTDLASSLFAFAVSSDGLDLDEFYEHIEGNIASMIQVMIDELGGLGDHRDEDVAAKLSEYFDFNPPITTLRNTPAAKPA